MGRSVTGIVGGGFGKVGGSSRVGERSGKVGGLAGWVGGLAGWGSLGEGRLHSKVWTDAHINATGFQAVSGT